MLTFARVWAVLFAIALAVGEALVALRVGKYWPLSLDDYAAVVGLLVGVWLSVKGRGHTVLVATWAYAVGNCWAVLFMRMDPDGGSGERLGLMTVLLVAAAVGLVSSAIAARRNG